MAARKPIRPAGQDEACFRKQDAGPGPSPRLPVGIATGGPMPPPADPMPPAANDAGCADARGSAMGQLSATARLDDRLRAFCELRGHRLF